MRFYVLESQSFCNMKENLGEKLVSVLPKTGRHCKAADPNGIPYKVS